MSCSSILLLQMEFVIQKIQFLQYRLCRTMDHVLHLYHNVAYHKIRYKSLNNEGCRYTNMLGYEGWSVLMNNVNGSLV